MDKTKIFKSVIPVYKRKGRLKMGKIGAVVLAIIAVLLLLAAGGISLGSVLDKWAIPVLVLIWAVAKLMANFKK